MRQTSQIKPQPQGAKMNDYITTAELANILKIRKNTIERWRTSRTCPIKWTRVNRRVLYALADVREYLDAQKTDRIIRAQN